MDSCKISMQSFLCLIVVVLFEVSGEETSFQLHQESVSLLSFKSGIVLDPQGALESWNSSHLHVCNWTGINCTNAGDHVRMVDLSHRSLSGTISSALAGLSSLVILDLSWNFFEGHIPAELGYLYQMRQLSLSQNLLQGSIPKELGYLHQLVYIDLGSNMLSGGIPESLFCNGTSLEYVDLSNNSLSGEIPSKNECQLSELMFLLLWSNELVGRVPPSLANSSKIQWLDLESNMLHGDLPSEIVRKMPELQILYLSYNDFVNHDGNTNLEPFFTSLVNSSHLRGLEIAGNNLGGVIPPIIGALPTNLVEIRLDHNLIYGTIPPHIANLVNLALLNLSSNLLNGTIPPELCRMGNLEIVYLSNNSLAGEIPEALGNISLLGLLDLSKNKLSGSIPDGFANLSQLRRLILNDNQLSGTIPPSLGSCVNLEILDLSYNEISGTIPDIFSNLSWLRRLIVKYNQLSRTIPPSLGGCMNLEILDLSHNKISGTISSGVTDLRGLKLYLNLSSNYLHGILPLELSKMDMIVAIDLSSNNLSGTIPSQLGNCIALEYLNLSGNALEGPFPASIGQLPDLKELDVSSNRLTGQIPESMVASQTLKQLNFSFNKFSGKVPNEGAFSSLTIDSFLENEGLCGSFEGMPRCRKKHFYLRIILPILLGLFGTPLLCMCGYLLVLRSKLRRQRKIFSRGNLEDENKIIKELECPKISYRQLNEATGGFGASSLIGAGRFGHVYKGVLRDNTVIAVKVLDARTAGAIDIAGSFKRECQVLKRARHRNLIRIITVCSKPDFKALVLPLMSNGSLERHLYPNHGLKPGLNLVQLVSICHDVAEGMAYLHNYAPVRVVHCDLKPSNVLLDDDMTALTTDFGIARLVKGIDGTDTTNDLVSFSSADDLLCGSLGHIAPEYGMGKLASTQGDVYSFGVHLLEIITGKRPTDVLSHEGSCLHEWVKSQYPHKLDRIVEQAMLRCAPSSMEAYLVKYGEILSGTWLSSALCAQNTILQQDQACLMWPTKQQG